MIFKMQVASIFKINYGSQLCMEQVKVLHAITIIVQSLSLLLLLQSLLLLQISG